MSNYTTQIRFICESKSGLAESTGFSGIMEAIENSVDDIFSFEWPIFDEAYRVPLEIKILRHFYTREIGEETFGLWQLRLCDRLNVIMPYYNQLYKSELLKFDPLIDVNLSTAHSRINDGDENGVRDDTSRRNISDVSNGKREEFGDEYGERLYDNITDREHEDSTVENRNTVENNDRTQNNSRDRAFNENENVNKTLNEDTSGMDRTNIDDNRYLGRTDNENVDSAEKYNKDEASSRTENVDKIAKSTTDGAKNETANKTESNQGQANKSVNGYTDASELNDSVSDFSSVMNDSIHTTVEESRTEDSNATAQNNSKGKTVNRYSDTPQGNVNIGGGPNDGNASAESVFGNGYLTNVTVVDDEKSATDSSKQSNQADSFNDGLTKQNKKSQDKTSNSESKSSNIRDGKTESETRSNTLNGDETASSDYSEYNETTDNTENNEELQKSEIGDRTGNTKSSKSSEESESANRNEVKNNKTARTQDEDMLRSNTGNEEEHGNETETVNHKGLMYGDENSVGQEQSKTKSSEKTENTNSRETLENLRRNSDLTGSLNVTHKRQSRTTEDFVENVFGKRGSMTYSKMLDEFRRTFLNIDKMVLNDLEPLFIGLWE